MKILNITFFILIVLFFISCKKQDVVVVKIDRFDTELYQLLSFSPDSLSELQFQTKYSNFLPIYIGGVLRLQNMGEENQFNVLRTFFKDSTLMKLYKDEQTKFAEVTWIETTLSEAMTNYKVLFPKDSIPLFRLHLSGLSQSVVTSGWLVSISGDKYMGSDYPLYKSYFYDYQLTEMETNRLPVDALKAFLEARFPIENSEVLLDRMIYSGVQQAAIENLLSELSPSQILGVDESQVKWLNDHEKNIWLYMVENEQLYTTDPLTITKYMESGPFTSYFGQESPSRIGQYLGYKIVKSYLKKKGIAVSSLLQHFDAKVVLSDSGYRP
ncbi:MAG: hypothetical protein PHV20_02295 [Bacteroidales bacterium]|nr:hypothetical protein [Bacteroidales bacterium]